MTRKELLIYARSIQEGVNEIEGEIAKPKPNLEAIREATERIEHLTFEFLTWVQIKGITPEQGETRNVKNYCTTFIIK